MQGLVAPTFALAARACPQETALSLTLSCTMPSAMEFAKFWLQQLFCLPTRPLAVYAIYYALDEVV